MEDLIKNDNNGDKKDEEIKELVIARLETMPPDRKLSIGSEGEFTRDELIESVKRGDEVGKKIIEIQLQYLQMLKEGIFYEQSFSNHSA
jgi:hypothetical protein